MTIDGKEYYELRDDQRYVVSADGDVKRLTWGRYVDKKMQTTAKGSRIITIRLQTADGRSERKVVGQARLVYTALNGLKLSDTDGHYIIWSDDGRPVDINRDEYYKRLNAIRHRSKLFEPMGYIAKIRAELDAYEDFYKRDDLSKLMDMVVRARPDVKARLRRKIKVDRRVDELAEEAESLFWLAVLERKNIYFFISKAIGSIAENQLKAERRRMKLMINV